MAKDWASDVKNYVPDADDGIIAGIVRYCGIALQKVDSSLVAFSDPVELARVRNNFLKKKCGLTDSDEVLDAAIADVGERMKADRTKNRVTVYYLLSDRFGMHHLFVKAAKTTAAKVTAAKVTTAKAAPVAAAAVALAGLDSGGGGGTTAAAPVVAPAAAMAAGGGAAGVTALGLAPLRLPIGRSGAWGLLADGGAGKSGRWFWWLALGLLALVLIWALFMHKPAAVVIAEPSGAAVEGPVVPAVEAVVPDGAGIITGTRDEKPVVKVYFETGKAEVAPAFAAEAVALKTYLDAHAGSGLGVSGYNDSTGNAAANAALSKRRADAVKAALVAASIPETAIALVKPEATTDTTTTNAEARRVEVFIK